MKKKKGQEAYEDKKRRTENRTDDMKHSTYYHSFFEGYTEARVPADNKKGYKIVRVYTSDYYVMKDAQSLQRKLSYLLLFAAGAVLFVLAAMPSTASNMAVYVALPVALSMIGLVFSGAVLFFYMSAPEKMTIYQHSYSDKLKLATGFAAIALGLSVLCTTASFLLIQDSLTLRALLSAVGYLAAFVCLLLLNRLENHTGYTREHNPTVGPEEGNVIC